MTYNDFIDQLQVLTKEPNRQVLIDMFDEEYVTDHKEIGFALSHALDWYIDEQK